MAGKNLTTSALLNRLLNTSSVSRFIERHEEEIENSPSFKEYINMLCAEKNVLPEHVIKKTDIARTYGHKIFQGTRKPTRDRVIQIGFGFEMDYNEMQKLLSVARKNPLSPRVKRDSVIIFALNKKYDIFAVQNTLYEMGITILGEER